MLFGRKLKEEIRKAIDRQFLCVFKTHLDVGLVHAEQVYHLSACAIMSSCPHYQDPKIGVYQIFSINLKVMEIDVILQGSLGKEFLTNFDYFGQPPKMCLRPFAAALNCVRWSAVSTTLSINRIS